MVRATHAVGDWCSPLLNNQLALALSDEQKAASVSDVDCPECLSLTLRRVPPILHSARARPRAAKIRRQVHVEYVARA